MNNAEILENIGTYTKGLKEAGFTGNIGFIVKKIAHDLERLLNGEQVRTK